MKRNRMLFLVAVTTFSGANLAFGQGSCPVQCDTDCHDRWQSGGASLSLCISNCEKGCVPVKPTAYGSRTYFPKYLVLSLLYSPPGNKSVAAYSTTNTEGTTTSISQSYATGDTLTVSTSASFLGEADLGAGYSTQTVTGNSQAFQITTSATTGNSLPSNSDAVQHLQDTFFLLLNPVVTVTQTGPSSGTYDVALWCNLTPTSYTPCASGIYADVISVNLAEAQNPSLLNSDPGKLGSQYIGPYTLPGLGTLTAEDWSQIASLDPLVKVPVTSAPPDSNRFQLVNYRPLVGPDYQGAESTPWQFSESDGSVTTNTQTETKSTTVSLNVGGGANIFGIFTLKLSNTSSWTWTDSTSHSQSQGSSNQESITLGSSTVGCDEEVDIYTDLMFHTFAYVTEHPELCSGTAANVQIALSGTVTDKSGAPQAHVLVTVTLADGSARRIYTDSKGRYGLYSVVPGPATIAVLGQSKTAQLTTSRPNVVDLVRGLQAP